MTIRITCECGKELHAPDEFAGRQTRCPVCKREITLVAASIAPPPPPMPPSPPPLPATASPAARPPSPSAKTKTAWQAVGSLLLGLLGVCLPLLASVP